MSYSQAVEGGWEKKKIETKGYRLEVTTSNSVVQSCESQVRATLEGEGVRVDNSVVCELSSPVEVMTIIDYLS